MKRFSGMIFQMTRIVSSPLLIEIRIPERDSRIANAFHFMYFIHERGIFQLLGPQCSRAISWPAQVQIWDSPTVLFEH